MEVVVDPQDEEVLKQHSWKVYRFGKKQYYATTKINGKTAYLHRVIAHAPDGMEVDHIDGNGLNNRRDNLRVVTHRQNLNNLHGKPNRGVYKVRSGRYQAKYKQGGRRIYLGTYDTIEEALEVLRPYHAV